MEALRWGCEGGDFDTFVFAFFGFSVLKSFWGFLGIYVHV